VDNGLENRLETRNLVDKWGSHDPTGTVQFVLPEGAAELKATTQVLAQASEATEPRFLRAFCCLRAP
jgi:hypothetical protein